jgi:hypothetical protein
MLYYNNTNTAHWPHDYDVPAHSQYSILVQDHAPLEFVVKGGTWIVGFWKLPVVEGEGPCHTVVSAVITPWGETRLLADGDAIGPIRYWSLSAWYYDVAGTGDIDPCGESDFATTEIMEPILSVRQLDGQSAEARTFFRRAITLQWERHR